MKEGFKTVPDTLEQGQIDHVSEVAVLRATIEGLQAELTSVDMALGNRLALDTHIGRAAKINAACARAGQADPAEAEVKRLRTQLDTQAQELARAIEERDRLRSQVHEYQCLLGEKEYGN